MDRSTPFEDLASGLRGYRIGGRIAVSPRYYIADEFNEHGNADPRLLQPRGGQWGGGE